VKRTRKFFALLIVATVIALISTVQASNWSEVTSFSGSGSETYTTNYFVCNHEEWMILWAYKPDPNYPDLAALAIFAYPQGETASYVASVFKMGSADTIGWTFVHNKAGTFYLEISTANTQSYAISIYEDLESISYVTLSISSTSGGYTVPSTGNYQYSMGFPAQVTAHTNPGYSFYWELNGLYVGSMSPITLIMTENATLHAVFQDDTAPVTTAEYDGSWQTVDIMINLTATDAGSGVQETFYRVNGGPTQNVSSNGMPHITTEGANNLLEYWSKDNTGNIESAKTKYVKIDKTPPAGSIQINANATYTNSTSVSIQFSAQDATSGIIQARFSNDNVTWSAWQPFSTNMPWNLTDDQGEKTVYAQIRDQAGLISPILTSSITVIPEFPPGLLFAVIPLTLFVIIYSRRRARFKAL